MKNSATGQKPETLVVSGFPNFELGIGILG